MVEGKTEQADRNHDNSSRLLQGKPLLHAQAKSSAASGGLCDEQEDQAMAASGMGQSRNARITSESEADILVEKQSTQESPESISELSTGSGVPKQNKWLVTRNELDFCGTIGGGRFSTIHKARFRGTMVAVKLLKDIGSIREVLEREIEIWSRLRHDHIVPFYGASTLASPPYIVSRYMWNGNLIQYLVATPNADRMKLIFEVSLGMYYLHEEYVVHGDLKGANVLVDNDGKACITDFGLSKLCSPATAGTKMSSISGTLRFLAPEALSGQPLSFETDVYAFGMLIYEVFTGEVPFISERNNLIQEGVQHHRLKLSKVYERGFNDTLWQLLSDCISHEPSIRPHFKTIWARICTMKKVEPSAESVNPGTEDTYVTSWGLDAGRSTDWGLEPGNSTDWRLNAEHSTDWGLDLEHPTDLGLDKARQIISALRSDLKAAHKAAETLKVDYDTTVARIQHDKSSLQSTLDAQTRAVANANQLISTLRSELEAAQEETFTGKADYDVKISCLQHDKSDLQSALDTLKREANEADHRLAPGISSFTQWMREASVNADSPIFDVDSSSSSSDIYNMLAYNAVMKAHSKSWNSAYTDARKSIDIRPSAMGHIAVALAQIGNDKPEEATQAFDLVFKDCNPNETNLLLLIKACDPCATILFVAGKHDSAFSRIHDLIAISRDDRMMSCYIQVLCKMYLVQGNYACAVQSLELAQIRTDPYLEVISFVFGWAFDGLQLTVQRYHCEALCAAGRIEEATEALLKILETFWEETRTSKVTAEWAMDFKKKCVDMLEALGDQALGSGEHDKGIKCYTIALSLNPSNSIDILIKRSKAHVSKGSWEDALMDAEGVIKLAPSSHLGYERKFAAFYGAKDYDEAYNALSFMFSSVESSTAEEICRLRENYTAPDETIDAIDTAVHGIFNRCPLVLIDVTMGKLRDAKARAGVFKSETPFKKLVSETAVTKFDEGHIDQSVAEYFKWMMFSHTWGGREEPTFKDVNLVDSVWELDHSPLNEKLQQFCRKAREDGYRWAWSDTCCIDKDKPDVLSESLNSMYRWYEEAAETVVYLADVSELGTLRKSLWMTRAWTLQELLASKVIRFYNCKWELYLNDRHTNHKESPVIKQEIANAMGVNPETITSFQPEDLGVRERLRLASGRKATKDEDIAYSLIGIFSSKIIPRYGVGKTVAIGELLENIVTRTGDVTVISWTGTKSSRHKSHNSALPDSLAVYSQMPYHPPSMEVSELDTRVAQLRGGLPREDVLAFYDKVDQLRPNRATFTDSCLHLPCITFAVTKLQGIQDTSGNQGLLYNARIRSLGEVEFRTADAILAEPRKLVFVHPWLRGLRDRLDESLSDDEADIESNPASEGPGVDGNPDGDSDASSASTPPLHAEPTAQVDRYYTQALQLIAHLGRPFNALLLERQPNGQYKRIAAEREIIIPGISYQTNPKKIQVKVLEII